MLIFENELAESDNCFLCNDVLRSLKALLRKGFEDWYARELHVRFFHLNVSREFDVS